MAAFAIGWTTLSLASGFTPASGQATPSYRVDGQGVVWLSGTIAFTSQTLSGQTLATLPAPLAPTDNLRFGNAGGGIVTVLSDGTIHGYTGTATTLMSLDGIQFLPAT